MYKATTMHGIGGLVLAASLLASCGRDTTKTNVKFAGVGLDPEEIGPYPQDMGGIIEVDWVEMAGGALPLGLMGLVSYDAIGPSMADFAPPYAAISGTAFVMSENMPATDTMFGNFGTAPSKVGTCYTSYDPRAFIGSGADVGTEISLTSPEGDVSYTMGRRPLIYGPDFESLYLPYYMELQAWRSEPRSYKKLVDPEAGLAGAYEDTIYEVANYRHGANVEVSFPGGMPPAEAGFGAIPLPLSAARKLSATGWSSEFTLPNRPEGVRLTWDGPRYGYQGDVLSEGEQSTCLQFLEHPEDPTAVEDCATLAAMPNALEYPDGQIYTGPWDTTDGLTFEWPMPENMIDETVTISVRFLGPVDRTDEYKSEGYVDIAASDDAWDNWEVAQDDGLIPSELDPPTGRRRSLACDAEEDVVWGFDDALEHEGGGYIASLQGEPSHTVAEVTCSVADADGHFTITTEMLEDALSYAQRQDSQGAVFYMARTTTLDVLTPPVRDRYGHKVDIAPVRVVSNAVQIGRFHFDQ
jgi:hypothetical protein